MWSEITRDEQMNPNFCKNTMKFYTRLIHGNWLRVITLHTCRIMVVTQNNIYDAWSMKFESLGLPCARGIRILSCRCYRCCVMIWTAPMGLKECVEKLGMDWKHLELQLVSQLQMALSVIWRLMILMLQKVEECLDHFYMVYVMCLDHWFGLKCTLLQNSILTC